MTTSDFNRVASMTEGYSNADIALIVQDALMAPVRKALKTSYFKKVKYKDNVTGVIHEGWTPCNMFTWGAVSTSMFNLESEELILPPVSMTDFEEALLKRKKTVLDEEISRYLEFTNKFGEKERDSSSLSMLDAEDIGVQESESMPASAPIVNEASAISWLDKVKGWFTSGDPSLTPPREIVYSNSQDIDDDRKKAKKAVAM